MVIDGPAGVGKTALLEAARAAADRRRICSSCERAAPSSSARSASASSASCSTRCCAAGRSSPTALFTGAARFAAPLLEVELDGATAVPPDDPFAARHALYWLTANLAAQRPLAMLVDDAHWADSASLGVLAHIANRLEGIPVALVVASRSEESLPALDALRRQAGGARDGAPRAAAGRGGRRRRRAVVRARRRTTRCAARATSRPAATRSCSHELARSMRARRAQRAWPTRARSA